MTAERTDRMLPPSILHGTVTVDASGVIDDEDMMEEGQIHCIAVQCFFARLPRLRDAPFSKKMETTEPKLSPPTGNLLQACCNNPT